MCCIYTNQYVKETTTFQQLNVRHQGRSSRLLATASATYFHFNQYRITLFNLFPPPNACNSHFIVLPFSVQLYGISILLMLFKIFTILCSILCEIFLLFEFHVDTQEVWS